MIMEIYNYYAYELNSLFKRGELCASEITKAFLDRIDTVDSKLNSFISVYKDHALASAQRIDEKRSKAQPMSALAAVPIGIKDNIAVKGMKMTCGSRMLENYISPYNASVIEKLNSADSVLIGKLNMDEFAMGSSSETSFFGAVRNPYDTNRVAGGSSGGCAAGVSACEVPVAIGSDTGGSIRLPASFCGAVGLKPTYSAVSRYGLTAFSSSLDQIGPVCRCVKDTALTYDYISGHDDRDSTSCSFKGTNCFADLRCGIKGTVVGVPYELFSGRIHPFVEEKFISFLTAIEKLGGKIARIKLNTSPFALPAYYVISSAEASSNLSRFDGVRYGFRADDYTDINDMYIKTRTQGFGEEVKRRIMLGTFVLSSGYYDQYYIKAVNAARQIKSELKSIMEKIDVIALPTAPQTAFKIGQKLDDLVEMYQNDVYTVIANLTGLPAISFPCGKDENGLPIGAQLIAGAFNEHLLLDMAYTYETDVGGFAKPEL